MRVKKLFAGIFLFLVCGMRAHAQSITGAWQGQIVEDGEFLQINIVQVGDKLCGYTWDYVYDNPGSHCKAYFNGVFVKSSGRWFMNGTNFIENSGTHVLMQLLVSVTKDHGRLLMSGICRAKPSVFENVPEPSTIKLYRVANKPAMMTETMKNCVEDLKPKKLPVKKPPLIQRTPVIKIPVAPKKPVLQKKKDSIPAQWPVIVPKDTAPVIVPHAPVIIPVAKPLPVKTAGRINREMRTITVHQKKITLYVYDNAEVDGDSISVYYNGRLMMSHMRLTEKPITLDITLDENTSLHSLVIFAENLGSLPPNTALIIFTDAAGKRYELFSRATLEENAELVFKYEP